MSTVPLTAGESAAGSHIRELPTPPTLFLPLLAHRDLPLRPLVVAGQVVDVGQPLATSTGDDDFDLVAPAAGTVRGLQMHPAPLPGTPRVTTLVVDASEPGSIQERVRCASVVSEDADASVVLARLGAWGLAGLGGAAFPVVSKLRSAIEAGTHTLIVNACSCDADSSADTAVLTTRPEAVAAGIRAIERALAVRSTVIATRPGTASAGQRLEAHLSSCDSADANTVTRRSLVCTFDYPTGAERRLVAHVRGSALPADSLPVAAGYLCQNVATFAAIADTLAGIAVTGRVLSISTASATTNVRALFGTPIATVLRSILGPDALTALPHARLLVGGRHAGYALQDTQAPVTAHVHAITFAATPAPTACIGCGRCSDVCAERLPAQLLYRTLAAGTQPGTLDAALAACLECGACDAVCPSHLPLTETLRAGRATLRRQQAQAGAAATARARFERHLQREARTQAAAAAAEAARRRRRARPRTDSADR